MEHAAVRAAAARRPGPPPRTADVPGHDLERAAAVLAVAALGIGYDLADGVTAGLVVAVLLAPVWWRSFALYRGGVLVVALVGAALVNGLLLTVARGTRLYDHRNAYADVALLVGFVAGVGVVLWARRVVGDAVTAASLGAGLTLWGFADAAGETNLWKYAVGLPISVLLLGLAALTHRAWVSLAALAALALASLAFDSRAYFAAVLLAALVFVWRNLPSSQTARRGWARIVLLLLGVAGLLYLLLSQLLVSGVLGTAAAERSQAQIDASGSLILGGRPEIAAFGALLAHHPMGFGIGVVPSYLDVGAAKAGMVAINYDPNNGYVENFMFGGRFELHSIVGDLWATHGLVGLALAAALLVFTLFVLGRGVATRRGSAVLFFAAVWTLWNIAFSPLLVSVPVLFLLVGLALEPRAAVDAASGGSARPGRATLPSTDDAPDDGTGAVAPSHHPTVTPPRGALTS